MADFQAYTLGTGGVTALSDAKPACWSPDILADGDGTTGGVGKFFNLKSAGSSVASCDKAGVATFSKVLTSTKKAITAVIDGGGSAITTGIKGDFMAPYACTISKVTAIADQSGSIVVDIWKDTYANFPPTDADSITASAPVTISSATKSQDSTLTGWSTGKNIAAGDILRFNVDSCTSITRVTILIEVSEV